GEIETGVAGVLLGWAAVVGSSPHAASARLPRSMASRARAPMARSSAADLRHALGGSDEAFLVDQVALLLAPDRALDDAGQVVVRGAAAHEVAQRCLVQREQACAQAALGRQPDAVAAGAASRGGRRGEA